MTYPVIKVEKFWPHAPLHRLSERGTYFVTAGTYGKIHHFAGAKRLDSLMAGLLHYAQKYEWHLEAWALFPNHYHFIARSPDNPESLKSFLAEFHKRSASWVNRLDSATGRKVWHNYRETRLSYEKSYFARLKYVHHNAVKHGMVAVANQYKWCSAAWFERKATPAMVKTIGSFKIDKLNIPDDY